MVPPPHNLMSVLTDFFILIFNFSRILISENFDQIEQNRCANDYILGRATSIFRQEIHEMSLESHFYTLEIGPKHIFEKEKFGSYSFDKTLVSSSKIGQKRSLNYGGGTTRLYPGHCFMISLTCAGASFQPRNAVFVQRGSRMR